MKTLKKSAVSIFIVFFVIFILSGMVTSDNLLLVDIIYSILLVLFLFKI